MGRPNLMTTEEYRADNEKLRKEIEKYKKALSKKGYEENFGRKEYRKLTDSYPITHRSSAEESERIKLLWDFEDWCRSY